MTTASALPDRDPTPGPKAPPPAELAAIVCAVETAWQPHHSVEEDVAHAAADVWKFANRWWYPPRRGAAR